MNAEQRIDSTDVVIPTRFRGPPHSANGGYACGLLGCQLHGPARVRLSEPPPLDTPLALRLTEPGDAELILQGRTIGRAIAAEVGWSVPAPVGFDAATHAAERFPWHEGHPYASCFVCGPERGAGDGLRILPGDIRERNVVAAPWVPDPSVCDASDRVQPEIVWAALDCPSWYGIYSFEPEFEPEEHYALLGELTAHIVERPRQGQRCVVLGWTRGRDGRKLYGGTAIYDQHGSLLASSAATWIELNLRSTAS